MHIQIGPTLSILSNVLLVPKLAQHAKQMILGIQYRTVLFYSVVHDRDSPDNSKLREVGNLRTAPLSQFKNPRYATTPTTTTAATATTKNQQHDEEDEEEDHERHLQHQEIYAVNLTDDRRTGF
jgi:hypothetical protein